LASPLVAIVDDDVPCLGMISDLLHEEGYRTVCCATAREVLTILGPACPDLVILDLWMETRGGGWQILDRLRGDPRTATVPVLICTADHASLAMLKEQPGGSDCAILTKPFNIEDLFAKVSTLLTVGCAQAARR
jgi:CheY-like chemotaxis protein